MARNTSTDIQRGERISLLVNQYEVSAYAGETLATVLLAQGITVFNRTLKGQPRGPYCNMGGCFECQVQMAYPGADTFNWVRACMVTADAGMKIITGANLSAQAGSPMASAADGGANQQQRDAADHEN